MDFFKLCDIAQKTFLPTYNDTYCGGKDYIGEDFTVIDERHRAWIVAVRQAGTRGRYIKFKSKASGVEVRASADGYKPQKYHPITLQEWKICGEYAQGNKDHYSRVVSLVNRLVK